MPIEKVRYELTQPIITSKAQIDSRDGWVVLWTRVSTQDVVKFAIGRLVECHNGGSLFPTPMYKHSETSLPELSNEVQAAISLRSESEASKKGESLIEHLEAEQTV